MLDARKARKNDIIRVRPDNDDLAHLAGIVGTVVNAENDAIEIQANSWQFSPHVSKAICPIVKTDPTKRTLWAYRHEFTIIG